MDSNPTPEVKNSTQLIVGTLWVALVVNPLIIPRFVSDPTVFRLLLLSLSLVVAFAFSPNLRASAALHSREQLPSLLIVALIAGHLVLGAPPYESLRLMLLVVVGAVLYLVTRSLNRDLTLMAMKLLTLSGSLVAFYAIIQAMGMDPLSYSTQTWMYRVVTTLGHRNFTAAFLLGCFFVALENASQKEVHSRLPLLQTLLIASGVIATGSRVPILIMAAVGIGLFFAQRKTRKMAAAVGITVAIGISLIAILGQGKLVFLRAETVELRLSLWRASLQVVDPTSFFGCGPGAFPRLVSDGLTEALGKDSAELVFLHTHMLPLEIGIELGWVGLILCGALLATAYNRARRDNPSRPPLIMLGHLSVLILNLYDVNIFFYGGWLHFWFLMGLMQNSDSVGSEQPNESSIRRVGWLPVLILLPSCAVLAAMTLSSHHLRTAEQLRTAGRSAESLGSFERAVQAFPLPLKSEYERAVAFLEAGDAQTSVRLLLDVESEAPGFSKARYNLAMAHARLELYENSLMWLEMYMEAFPGDQTAYIRLLQLARYTDTAYEVIDRIEFDRLDSREQTHPPTTN